MNKIHRNVLSVFLLFALAVVFSGCGKKTEKVSFVIGLVTPLTGEVADLGKEVLSSAELAVDEAGKENPQISMRLIARDDQMSSTGASASIKELLSLNKLVVVLGAGMSPVVKGEIEALKGSNVPLLTSTATTNGLSDGLHIFRVIPANSQQAKSLAEYALNLPARKAAIIFQQEDYSEDLRNAFKEAFTNGGGSIIKEIGFEGEESDFRSQLEQIKFSQADVVLCAAQNVPIARMLIRAREMNIQQPILSGETAFTDKLLNAAGKAADGLLVAGPAVDLENPTPDLQKFINSFMNKNGGRKPGIYACYTFDAVKLLASAIVQQKATDGKSMIRYLRSLKSYFGVTGQILFDSAGDVQRSYNIFTVKNGRFEIVKANR